MSGQFAFTKEDGLKLTVDKATAQGKKPYRAFVHMQLCNGKKYSQCWTQPRISLSFSFKTQGLSQVGVYVKLLFWTDISIAGLLPPGHPKSGGKFRLVAFPNDDYPESWTHEAEVEDDRWYQLQIDYSPATWAVALSLDGMKLGDGSLSINVLDASIGPQMGVYSFDRSNQSWPDGFALWLDNVCIGEAVGACSTGSVGEREPTPNPLLASKVPPATLPLATPRPTPRTAPAFGQFQAPIKKACSTLCSLTNLTAAGRTCSLQQDQKKCEASYIARGLLSFTCAWIAHSCFVEEVSIMYCPSASDLCKSEAIISSKGRQPTAGLLMPLLLFLLNVATGLCRPISDGDALSAALYPQ